MKTLLLRHERTVFEDATVYLTGHAYVNCDFNRCTLVLRGTPFALEENKFNACVLDIDCVLWNADQADDLVEIVNRLKAGLLPSPKALAQNAGSAGTEQPG